MRQALSTAQQHQRKEIVNLYFTTYENYLKKYTQG